jgi:hypothetical protein
VPKQREPWSDISGVRVARPDDWKDAQAYEKLLSLPADPLDPREVEKRWAWEFLRRRPDYQRAYLEWQRLSPQKRRRETADRATPFYLDRFIPPIEAAPVAIPFLNTFALRMLCGDNLPPGKRGLSLSEVVSESTVAILFDRRLPLPMQLEMAAAQLSDKVTLRNAFTVATTTPRRQYKNFCLYLRLLDAKASGVPNKHIASQLVQEGRYKGDRQGDYLYPGQSSLDKDLPRARDLRDGNYLIFLPYRSSEAGRKLISKLLSVSTKSSR